MKKPNFQIILKLEDELPFDFSISYDELTTWNLNKYKAYNIKENDQLNINLKSLREVELIRDDPRFIAGRFKILVDNNEKISEIPFDLMIAKIVKEKKKNRCGFRTPYFKILDKKQIFDIHKLVVDGIMPECLKKIWNFNEYQRQKKLIDSK